MENFIAVFILLLNTEIVHENNPNPKSFSFHSPAYVISQSVSLFVLKGLVWVSVVEKIKEILRGNGLQDSGALRSGDQP